MHRIGAVASVVAALFVSGCGLLESRVEATWQLAPGTDLVESDTVIEIWVIDPHCEDKLATDEVEIAVVETDSSVVVTARVPDESGVACKFRANPVPVEVSLSSPLGARQLLVGSATGDAEPSSEHRGGLPIPTG